MPKAVNHVEYDGNTLIDLRNDTVTSAEHIMAGYYGHLADGRRVLGTGQAATRHTLYFEYEDETTETVYAYYDDALISPAITATTPTKHNNKKVTLAQLDGTTWYSYTPALYTLKQGTVPMSSGNSCTLSDGNHCEVVTTSNGRMAYVNQTKGQNGAPQNFKTTIFTLSQGDEWEFRVKNIEFASNASAANYFAISLYNLADATDVASGQMAYSELTPGTLADVTATGTIETATNVTSVLFYFHRACEMEFDFEFYVNGVRYL